jgi:hypothetical protein
VNGGPLDDKVDHYNVAAAVGSDGRVHIMYRQRDETENPLVNPYIDTYYVESRDGGRTFTRPLKVDRVPSDLRYDAFSQGGAFEGDYNQLSSAGPYTFIVRCQGAPAYKREPAALAAVDATTLKLARRSHQHQSAWVAVVQDLPKH